MGAEGREREGMLARLKAAAMWRTKDFVGTERMRVFASRRAVVFIREESYEMGAILGRAVAIGDW